MSKIVNVAGPALIQVDTGAANALEDLGYTANGAEIEFRGFFGDVPGDENGGESGPPIDVQYFGEIAVVRLELTKYDAAILDKLVCRLYGGTAGTPGTAGTLMFNDSKTYRLLIKPTTLPFNFPRAIYRGSRVVNRGTKFSREVCEFECHKNASGVLYNTTTS